MLKPRIIVARFNYPFVRKGTFWLLEGNQMAFSLHSSICSFNEHFLSTYCVPLCTVLAAGDSAINKTESLLSWKHVFPCDRDQTVSRIMEMDQVMLSVLNQNEAR